MLLAELVNAPDGARKRLCFEPGFESYSTYSNFIQRDSSLIWYLILVEVTRNVRMQWSKTYLLVFTMPPSGFEPGSSRIKLNIQESFIYFTWTWYLILVEKSRNPVRNVRMQWSKYLSIGPQYAPVWARERSRWMANLVNLVNAPVWIRNSYSSFIQP